MYLMWNWIACFSPCSASVLRQPKSDTKLRLESDASYSTPANSVPQLNPSEIRPDPEFQRRLVYPPQPEADPAASKTGVDAVNSSNTNPVNVSPPVINMPANPAPVVDQSGGNQTASLIRGKWGYSPVRHAGYLTSSTATVFPMQAQAVVSMFVRYRLEIRVLQPWHHFVLRQVKRAGRRFELAGRHARQSEPFIALLSSQGVERFGPGEAMSPMSSYAR